MRIDLTKESRKPFAERVDQEIAASATLRYAREISTLENPAYPSTDIYSVLSKTPEGTRGGPYAVREYRRDNVRANGEPFESLTIYPDRFFDSEEAGRKALREFSENCERRITKKTGEFRPDPEHPGFAIRDIGEGSVRYYSILDKTIHLKQELPREMPVPAKGFDALVKLVRDFAFN